MSGLRVGVVGATGQVGGVMRRILAERGFPVAQIRYFASARSAGTTLPWGDSEVVVEDAAVGGHEPHHGTRSVEVAGDVDAGGRAADRRGGRRLGQHRG